MYLLRSYYLSSELDEDDRREILIVEEHLLSPQYLMKHSIDPQEMKQYVYPGKNFELVFLLTNSKLLAIGREDPPNFSKGKFKQLNKGSSRIFTPYFVVSNIDILGMGRLLNTLDDFCDLSDF